MGNFIGIKNITDLLKKAGEDEYDQNKKFNETYPKELLSTINLDYGEKLNIPDNVVRDIVNNGEGLSRIYTRRHGIGLGVFGFYVLNNTLLFVEEKKNEHNDRFLVTMYFVDNLARQQVIDYLRRIPKEERVLK